MIRYSLIFLFFIFVFLPVASYRAVETPSAYAKGVNKNEADVLVEVSALNGLERGSKVLSNGIIVGKVSFVDSREGGKSVLGVDLGRSTSIGVLNLSSDTIALIKSPMTVDPNNRLTLLELFIPTKDSSKSLKKGNTIKGFCSFEEFWKADLGEIGSSYETNSLS